MLGVHLMREMSRRGGGTESLLRDAGQQSSYCLDAPDEIPAGTVDWYSCMAGDIDISGPLDRMVQREA